MITISCVKWGNKYGPEFVNRLQNMVKKNFSHPYRFVCLTENSDNVDCETLPFPKDNDLETYWNKMYLFNKEYFTGKCIYFDLDIIIQNNFDDMIQYTNKLTGIYTYWNDTYTDGNYPYATLKWKVPFNSSILAWNAEDYHWVWDKFNEERDWYIIKYFGDDKFLGNEIIDRQTFPKEWTYTRLYGRKKHDDYTHLIKLYEGCYEKVFYFPEYKFCLFNGPTEEKHYKGFEKYWS